MPDVQRRAVRGLGWAAVGSWAARLSAVAVVVVLATRLDAADFGVVGVAAATANVLVVAGDLGFAQALVWYPGPARAAGESAFLIAILSGTALGLGLLLVSPLLASFLHVPSAAGLLGAYALVVALGAASRAPLGMLTRELDFARRVVPEAVPSVVGAAVTVAIAFAGHGHWSLLIGDVVRGLVTLPLAIAVQRAPFRPRWHGEVARELWRFARGALLNSSVVLVLQGLDYLLVGRVLGPAALGLYTLAFRAATFAYINVAFVVADVEFPALARLMPDTRRMLGAFSVFVRLGCAASFLLGGGLAAVAPSLAVLGDRWSAAGPTARILGAYVCLRSAAHLVTPLLQAIGRPGTVAALNSVWVALVLLGIVTVGRSGIESVALVQVGVAALLLLMHVGAARVLAGAPPGRFLTDAARPAAAAVAAGLAVAAVRGVGGGWLVDGSPATLALLVAVFTGGYAAALAVLDRRLWADLGLRPGGRRGPSPTDIRPGW